LLARKTWSEIPSVPAELPEADIIADIAVTSAKRHKATSH
jgi:hypothetical protein